MLEICSWLSQGEARATKGVITEEPWRLPLLPLKGRLSHRKPQDAAPRWWADVAEQALCSEVSALYSTDVLWIIVQLHVRVYGNEPDAPICRRAYGSPENQKQGTTLVPLRVRRVLICVAVWAKFLLLLLLFLLSHTNKILEPILLEKRNLFCFQKNEPNWQRHQIAENDM